MSIVSHETIPPKYYQIAQSSHSIFVYVKNLWNNASGGRRYNAHECWMWSCSTTLSFASLKLSRKGKWRVSDRGICTVMKAYLLSACWFETLKCVSYDVKIDHPSHVAVRHAVYYDAEQQISRDAVPTQEAKVKTLKLILVIPTIYDLRPTRSLLANQTGVNVKAVTHGRLESVCTIKWHEWAGLYIFCLHQHALKHSSDLTRVRLQCKNFDSARVWPEFCSTRLELTGLEPAWDRLQPNSTWAGSSLEFESTCHERWLSQYAWNSHSCCEKCLPENLFTFSYLQSRSRIARMSLTEMINRVDCPSCKPYKNSLVDHD